MDPQSVSELPEKFFFLKNELKDMNLDVEKSKREYYRKFEEIDRTMKEYMRRVSEKLEEEMAVNLPKEDPKSLSGKRPMSEEEESESYQENAEGTTQGKAKFKKAKKRIKVESSPKGAPQEAAGVEESKTADVAAITKQQKDMLKRFKMLQNEVLKMNEKTKKSIAQTENHILGQVREALLSGFKSPGGDLTGFLSPRSPSMISKALHS